ncbi:peptidase C14 [Vibrio furnissii]|uniref:peptidase C14 n=1 Tax=Vibrio furnissii TaxID=29494 RepID=UPI0024BABA3B|nr:peptidase C14 [Vibrio furnissii]WHR52404.1 peptidase C14 [Vibrio furnissii]
MPVATSSNSYAELINRYSSPSKKRVLAEGDSWFAYPKKYFILGGDSNIIDHLADRNDLLIYNTSSNGDEAVNMLSGDQKISLLKRLSYNSFDYLLFSGGGNDIVGKYDFDFFIRKYESGYSWLDCIDQGRINLKLEQIKLTYKILCQLTQEFSQNESIKIVTHTYDIARPVEKGFELFDVIPLGKSWMHPYLVKKGITQPEIQEAIVHHLLKSLKDALLEVQSEYPILQVVDTQGLLNDEQWLNEIHPNSEGFGIIADKIYNEALS